MIHKIGRKSGFLRFFVFLAILFLTKNGDCLDLDKWGERMFRWSEPMSTWNPVGQDIFRPIESLIPGLYLKGFLENETDIMYHNRDDTIGLPKRHSDIEKIQWLFELETRYRLSDRIEFTNILNFLYNAAYDWDDQYRKDFGPSAHYLEYYKHDRILREMYVDFIGLFSEKLDIRLGKQQVVYGRAEGRKIMDVINPEDFREFADPAPEDWEFSRLPLWMANFNYSFTPDFTLQFLWIPDYQPSESPRFDSPYGFQRPVPPPFVRPIIINGKRPHGNFRFDDDEYAFQFSWLKNGWDMHLLYFYTWSDMPTFFRKAFLFPRGRPTPANPIRILLQPRVTRLHQVGFNFDKSVWWFNRQITWKFESMYTMNRYQSTDAEPNFMDGVVKKDDIFTGFGFLTYVHHDWYIFFRQDLQYFFSWNSKLRTLPIRNPLKRDNYGTLLNIRKSFAFTQDRLSLSNTTIYTDQGEWSNSLKFTLKWTDYITLELTWRERMGNKTDPSGQFDKMDQIEVGLVYNF